MFPAATRLLSYFRNSSSLPALVAADDGRTYVVKWHGAGEGASAVATDLICNRLAAAAGIAVPGVTPIRVPEELATQTKDPDLRDLIIRSAGLNLGVAYLPQPKRFVPEDRDSVSPGSRSLLYAFDVLMVNIDRTVQNPNLLGSNGTHYAIDFSSSLSVKLGLENQTLNDTPFLRLLRVHPYYVPAPERIPHDFRMLVDILPSVLGSVPSMWLDADTPLQRLLDSLTDLFTDSPSILDRRFGLIDSIVPETADEHRRRTNANRAAFEAAAEKLQKKSPPPPESSKT